MKRRATVGDWMTAAPLTIGEHETIARAHRVMRQKHIRHLPVIEQEKLVGVVSLNDVLLFETLRSADPERDIVSEAMTEEPYTVHPTASLALVAKEMAEKRYGSAVVVQNGQVVGLFTTVDALRALANVMTEE